MHRIYSIRQRWVAYTLLLSLFLQSCLNSPIPPALPKSNAQKVSHPLPTNNKITNYIQNQEYSITKGTEHAMKDEHDAMLSLSIQNGPISNLQSNSKQEHTVSDLLKESLKESTNSTTSTANQPISNGVNQPAYNEHHVAEQNSLSKTHFRIAKNRQIPSLSKALNTSKATDKTQIDTHRINISTENEKNVQGFTDGPLLAATPEFNHEELEKQLMERTFTAVGGYKVSFEKLENKWLANVQHDWVVKTKGTISVPVYIEVGIRPIQLLKMNEFLQQRRIHIIFSKHDKYLPVAVYLGNMGLLGAGNYPLHEAAVRGDVKRIQELISGKSVNINIQDQHGQTALHAVTKSSHLEIQKQLETIDQLIHFGASVNIQDNEGNTLLHLAVIQGKVEMAKLVLPAHGRDINIGIRNNVGKTALHYAAAAGYEEITTLLLKNTRTRHFFLYSLDDEVSKNQNNDNSYLTEIQDEQGNTALHYAVEKGHTEIVIQLLKGKANLYIRNINGLTPLHIAFNTNQTELVQAILKDDKLFPLHWAIKNKDINLIKQLINAGVHLNSLNLRNEYPLYIAFREDQLDIAKILLEAGANINFQDEDGISFLHIASERKEFSIINNLIKFGANANLKDKVGRTPLHIAAETGHSVSIIPLLEAGADLYTKTNNDYIPLDCAMNNGRLNTVEILFIPFKNKFYANRCAARAHKQITLPKQQDKPKVDSTTNILQPFFEQYPTTLALADKEKFSTTFATILEKQLTQVSPSLQAEVIDYFQQGGKFYLSVLEEYDVQDWVKESLILDIIQATSVKPHQINAYKFREKLISLASRYSDNEFNCFLYALQQKQATDQLDLLTLCNILTYLSTSTPRQALEWLELDDKSWLFSLRLAWLSEQVKSLINFTSSKRNQLTHALGFLAWRPKLISAFLAGLKNEKKWKNVKSLFSFISLNNLPDDILLSTFHQQPVKEKGSYAKSWRHYLICKKIKLLLKDLFPHLNSTIESQIDNLLLNKLWLYDIVYEILIGFLEKKPVYTDVDAERFSQVLELLNEYDIIHHKGSKLLNEYGICYKGLTLENGLFYKDIFDIIKDNPSEDWEKKVHQRILQESFYSESSERKVSKNIEYIAKESPYNIFANQEEALQAAYQATLDAYKGVSKLLTTNSNPISNWKQEEIKEWANHIKYSTTIDFTLPTTQYELVAVVKRAVELHHPYPPRNTQLLSVLVLLNPTEGKGRLAQINTGEGKSLIVAMLAALHTLQRKKVDVVTTSTELSIREVDKQEGFFDIFGLTVGENSNDELNSGIYTRDIVYGTAANFQRDILLTEFLGKDNRGSRNFGVVIVDEVDSMLFDSRNYNLRISSQLPAMNHLEVILGALFNFVNLMLRHLVEKDGKTYYIPEDFEIKGDKITIYPGKQLNLEDNEVKDKESCIVNAATNYLNVLLRDPVGNDEAAEWQDYNTWSAQLVMLSYKLAREKNSTPEEPNKKQKEKLENLEKRYKELEEKLDKAPWKNKDQIIQIPKHLREFALKQIPNWTRSALLAICFYKKELHYDVKDGEIVPIDYDNTGVLQENMVWNDGLAQMLQIKEGLKVKPESISTNFISTPGFFKRYGHAIYGLTGTLGNQPTHNFLSEVYNTDLVIIPPYKRPIVKFNKNLQYLCKELTPIIVPTYQEWHDAICKSVLSKVRNQRAVLVICKYIDQVKRLAEHLGKHHDSSKIFTYTGQEKFTKEHIDTGEIIVATNIAGRGTDITTTDNVEEHGGMHVCITFLPDTYRVELQNAGRTARQGKKGTVQLIIHNTTTNDIKVLRDLRDLQESIAINRAKQDVAEMDFQDQLFNHFCALESELLPNIDNAKKIQHYQILEEHWKHTQEEFLSSASIASAYQAQLNTSVQSALHDIICKLEADFSKIPENQWGQYEFCLELNTKKKLKISEINTRQDLQKLKGNLEQFIRKDLSTTTFKEETFQKEYTTTIRNLFCETFKSKISADVIEAFRAGKPFIPQNGELAAEYKWGEQERKAIEERWGFWLHHTLRGKRSDKQAIQTQFDNLATQIRENAKENKLIKNPYFYVQKGNEFLAQGANYLAIETYDRAISLDHLYSVNAYYNKARALLQTADNRQYLRSARKSLQQAKILLANKHQDDLMLFYSLVGQSIGAKPTFLNHIRHQLDILVEQQKYIDAALHQLYIAKEKKWDIEVKEVKPLKEIFKDAAEDHKEAIDKAALNGLTHLYTIEAKQPYPWQAILCLVFLGVAQIAAGIAIALCTYGTGANVARALITEGISDLITAGKTVFTGRFDWKEWGIQKVISILSSLAVVGLKAASKGFKKAWETIENFGTLNTGIAQDNFKVLVKDVSVSLAKGVTKELINSGIDAISNDWLVKDIQQSIENSITEQLEKLIAGHPLMRKALELDIAQHSKHWQNILIQEGMDILTKPGHPFVKFLMDLGKSIAGKAAVEISQFLEKEGCSSTEAAAFRWVCKLPFMHHALIEITRMTKDFFETFSNEIESKYKVAIQKATVGHINQAKGSNQEKSTKEHVQHSAAPPEASFESGNINVPRTGTGAEYASKGYKSFDPLYGGGYEVAGNPEFRVASKFGQTITTKITNKIQSDLVQPFTREMTSAFIEKMAKKITKSTNEAVQSRRKQGKTHYLGNKLANNLADESEAEPLPELEDLPPALQEKIKALQAGEPCDITDLPFFAKRLGRPIYITDKKTGQVFDVFGKKLKGEPIFLQHDPTGEGHWSPRNMKVEESGKNNCMVDGLYVQLTPEERQKLGIKSEADLRKLQIETLLRNPQAAIKLLYHADIMRASNPAYMMVGGSLLSKTADGLIAADKWLEANPEVAKVLANTGKVLSTALWLKKFTPIGFLCGLIVDYGYDKLMEYIDTGAAKEKLAAYLQSKDSDLNKEQADILAGAAIKFAQEAGRVLIHSCARKGFDLAKEKVAPNMQGTAGRKVPKEGENLPKTEEGLKILKPLGKRSTGRNSPNNLTEKLAMKEIMSNPRLGKIIKEGIKDSRWCGWSKMQYVHRGLDGSKIVIHYVGKFKNGILKAVDDFKFK